MLTPLLVESYRTLRRDSSETIIALLRQISQQSASPSVNVNLVNSSATPSTDADASAFTPSVNAKRVNILWFASLVLSLASASFAITVKQWLTEYLAGEFSSPQVRLRVRHFRHEGLKRWKAFEIACLLPLLLQLALALFFVGLCFFTADIQSELGHTTLPLVAAWAALLVFSIFAPVFDPACPYKTPYLRTAHVYDYLRNLSYRLKQ